jgi:hypothetical protein
MVIFAGGHAALRPESREPVVGLGMLWFGLFGAPAAWAIQLISSYALFAHFCYPKGTPLSAPAFGGTRVVAIVVSLALVLVAALALFVSIRSARSTATGEESAGAGEGRIRFMARAGVLVSGIFVYGTLMAAIPLISMRPCTL